MLHKAYTIGILMKFVQLYLILNDKTADTLIIKRHVDFYK
jgi:hypothetical protein